MNYNFSSNIIFKNNKLKSETLRELYNNAVNNLSSRFKTNDKVIVYMNRDPNLLIILYAMFQMNITYIPINPDMPVKRIEYIMNSVNYKGIIVSKILRQVLPSEYNTIDAEELITEFKGEMINIEDSKDIYTDKVNSYILFTSGTTGKPKGVMIKKSALLNLIDSISQEICFVPEKTILCLTTVGFDIFFIESIMAMYKGIDVILVSKEEESNPRAIVRIIAKYKIDIIQMTPSRLQVLQSVDPQLKFLKNVKDIMIGGEELPINLLKILQKNVESNIWNCYGPTETTVWSSICNLTKSEEVSIGIPIKNTKIYIVNDSLKILSDGNKGQIAIIGEGLAFGYYNMPEFTEMKFIDINGERAFLTGDYGYYSINHMLYFLGRIDNQIKLRGYRIELEEIERTMDSMDKVTKSACIVIKSEEIKKIILFYNAEEELDLCIVKQYFASLLPQYMIPDEVIYCESLIFNVNGKIDRNGLKELYSLNLEKNNSSIEKLNECKCLETKILNIICEKMQRKEISVSDRQLNLLDLGWNSIMYIDMIVRIENEFDILIEDDKLVLSYFNNFDEIIHYITQKIFEKNSVIYNA